ncbi:hypothetical protein MRB53_037547 [Persea americana]|nr:hypothetical protein MRB53_037547 [Persea americana]
MRATYGEGRDRKRGTRFDDCICDNLDTANADRSIRTSTTARSDLKRTTRSAPNGRRRNQSAQRLIHPIPLRIHNLANRQGNLSRPINLSTLQEVSRVRAGRVLTRRVSPRDQRLRPAVDQIAAVKVAHVHTAAVAVSRGRLRRRVEQEVAAPRIVDNGLREVVTLPPAQIGIKGVGDCRWRGDQKTSTVLKAPVVKVPACDVLAGEVLPQPPLPEPVPW